MAVPDLAVFLPLFHLNIMNGTEVFRVILFAIAIAIGWLRIVLALVAIIARTITIEITWCKAILS